MLLVIELFIQRLKKIHSFFNIHFGYFPDVFFVYPYAQGIFIKSFPLTFRTVFLTKKPFSAQTGTKGTITVRTVKAKKTRFNFRKTVTIVWTGVFRAKKLFRFIRKNNCA